MAGSGDDDLDWLYRRGPAEGDSRPAGPEATRIVPTSGADPRPTAELPSVPPATRPVPPYQAGHRAHPGPDAGTGRPPAGSVPGSVGRSTRRPRRRRPLRIWLGVLAGLLVLGVVALVAVPVYAWSQVTRVEDDPEGDRPARQPGTTFLLVGSDSRKGLTKAERKRLSTGRRGGEGADTVMVMHIPPGGKPALVSLPRDSYVTIPGKGKNKINAAYSAGGSRLIVQTVEQNTGLRVDGYLEVGFGGFVNVIDSLGGIEMCVPKAVKDKRSNLKLAKGCQELTGAQALGYVRMRYADPRGDLGRVERQRQMLAAVAKKAASPATVLNPVRYWGVSNASASALRLGQDTSAWEVAKLARAMTKVSGDEGYTLTVPISDPDLATPVGSAVKWDRAKARKLFADLARGDTTNLGKYAK